MSKKKIKCAVCGDGGLSAATGHALFALKAREHDSARQHWLDVIYSEGGITVGKGFGQLPLKRAYLCELYFNAHDIVRHGNQRPVWLNHFFFVFQIKI